MSWTDTPLSRRLGVALPIIQAPMAGGVTTPALVAAVSDAGGLGCFGAAAMAPDALRQAVRDARQHTDRPIAVNLFVPNPATITPEDMEAVAQALAPARARLGLPPLAAPAAPAPFEAQLAVVIEERVPVFSFTFGALAADKIALLKKNGIAVLGTATTVEEAQHLEALGVDAIVAQGGEAGGHRGTFLGSYDDGMIGTLSLVPRVVDAVSLPVVAAGGIMDGRGIAAALALGAAGVQLGTAFLTSPEAGTHPAWKTALLGAAHDATVMTRGFTGKPARVLRNAFVMEMAEKTAALPAYPKLDLLSRDIRMAAAQQGKPDYLPLFAGQSAHLCRALPAGDLTRTLAVETAAALARMGAMAG